MKFRRFIAFITLAAVIFSPFFDSMACDDFAQSSPAPGTAMTICCKDFSGGSPPLDEAGGNPGDLPLPESHVHVLCPVCLAVADGLSSYGPDLFEAAIFTPIPFTGFLIQPSIPIYKPPQNQSTISSASFV
jgi:hypothetical protein